MGESLGWVLGCFCGAVIAVKLLGTVWCFVELHRKWRPVPELWALDWLDIVFRVERESGVALTAADFASLSATARVELTAGHLWEVVTSRMRTAGAVVPSDGWERLVTALSEALSVRPARIAPGSRLYADLNMSHGIE